ncbi:hypothetical protein [Nonomuraea sp. NPDC005501]|uniref:hypothetical protein n=1 Tax=Nonomuraea sp. NPDC005501 TaxID=3156884 RepID=UPI0033B8812D
MAKHMLMDKKFAARVTSTAAKNLNSEVPRLASAGAPDPPAARNSRRRQAGEDE